MAKHYHEQNRKSWNAATKQHHTHTPDLIERYKKGWNNLFPEDMELLGDLAGKKVAHLQCNDGQDTISIAKFCGADVTGIDISDYAIESARELAQSAGIPAKFVRLDIFEWFESNEASYDMIYTSYGTIGWIADIKRWAQGIANSLKAGGKFVMVDFHPLIGMYENDWSLKYDYMNGEIDDSAGVSDYVGDDYEGAFQNPEVSYQFAWGIGDTIGALLDAGLTLRHFKEYDYMNGWQRFPGMHQDGRRFFLLDDKPNMPLMFSLVATKADA